MSLHRRLLIAVSGFFMACFSSLSLANTIHVVAAENFYSNVAKQIGGQHVAVESILSNPEDNPHLFEVSPKVAKSLADAQIVIYSGAGYDDWMPKLIADHTSVTPIEVAALVARQEGDNPHIWYDPHTMLTLAVVLKNKLSQLDPAHQADYTANWKAFTKSMHPLLTRIDQMRTVYAGMPVTATEPVFGYMFDQLGFKVRNADFQLAVMNDTDPSVSQVKAFQDDLKYRRVAFLLYNNQVEDPSTTQLKNIAIKHHVPVVGATETMPDGLSYQQWINQELDEIQQQVKP